VATPGFVQLREPNRSFYEPACGEMLSHFREEGHKMACSLTRKRHQMANFKVAVPAFNIGLTEHVCAESGLEELGAVNFHRNRERYAPPLLDLS